MSNEYTIVHMNNNEFKENNKKIQQLRKNYENSSLYLSLCKHKKKVIIKALKNIKQGTKLVKINVDNIFTKIPVKNINKIKPSRQTFIKRYLPQNNLYQMIPQQFNKIYTYLQFSDTINNIDTNFTCLKDIKENEPIILSKTDTLEKISCVTTQTPINNINQNIFYLDISSISGIGLFSFDPLSQDTYYPFPNNPSYFTIPITILDTFNLSKTQQQLIKKHFIYDNNYIDVDLDGLNNPDLIAFINHNKNNNINLTNNAIKIVKPIKETTELARNYFKENIPQTWLNENLLPYLK
tara:strand:+ start:170 stop:1054 length:885 start_codon:yes stop_codon:yes gene_type:complete